MPKGCCAIWHSSYAPPSSKSFVQISKQGVRTWIRTKILRRCSRGHLDFVEISLVSSGRKVLYQQINGCEIVTMQDMREDSNKEPVIIDRDTPSYNRHALFLISIRIFANFYPDLGRDAREFSGVMFGPDSGV